MRLNLNFKDATILRVSQNEFKISFDMSTLNKPRLSPDARVYIEHFNLPEFIDEKNGRNKGDLHGYFELRCDNINNGTDWDSEYGQTGSVILFQSPLTNFATFTNNDPMYIRNFKINQNFFTNKLTFTLRIYDRKGQPFVSSQIEDSEIDDKTIEYVTYQTKLNELKVLTDSKKRNDAQEEFINETNNNNEINLNLANDEMTEALQKLVYELNVNINTTSTTGPALQYILRFEIIRDITLTNSYQHIIYLYEVYLKTASIAGLRLVRALQPLFDRFYETYLNYLSKQKEFSQSEVFVYDILSKKDVVWQQFENEFTPNNVLVKPDKLTGVDYEVVVSGGTNKTGKLDCEFFNSVENKIVKAVVSNITPNAGTNNILQKDDVLTIDKSEFKNILPDTFSYVFSKLYTASIDNVSFPGSANDSRIIMVVERTDKGYDVSLDKTFDNRGFTAGNTILVKGSALGGEDGDAADIKNDVLITINSIIEYNSTYDYDFPAYNDPDYDDNGDFDIKIQRDNVNVNDNKIRAKYVIISQNFTRTKNYASGNEIVINGLALGGVDGTHDLTIVVGKVNTDKQEDTLDGPTTSDHSIPKTLIEGLVVKDSSDNDKGTAKDYKIDVLSDGGDYKVDLNSADGSEGFSVGDYIIVKGSLLTGKDGVNDLKINIDSVDATTGKILTLSPDASTISKVRSPDTYTWKITRKINDPKYYVEMTEFGDKNQFVKGDIFKIPGDKLGGKTPDNDATITITDITDDAIIVQTTGIANSQTGNIGEILDIKIKGNAFKNNNTGQITQAGISWIGTPIDTTPLPTPSLNIKIVEEPYYGQELLESLVQTKYNEVVLAKNSLKYIGKTYFLTLDDQLDKIKCMNMSLVLYDEVPEYVSSSYDAIRGNTYSRLSGCQSKRI